MNRPAKRYVVLMYFYDHWAVNVETDELETAQYTAQSCRAKQFKAVVVDTEAVLSLDSSRS